MTSKMSCMYHFVFYAAWFQLHKRQLLIELLQRGHVTPASHLENVDHQKLLMKSTSGLTPILG